MVIQEQDLERLTLCPLLTTIDAPQERCAREVVSWALRKSFNGIEGKPEAILEEIRGQIIKSWKSNKVVGDVGRVSRTAGYNLFQLLLDYEIIHLEEPYNLVLTEYTIQGKYALLRKRKGAELPFILVVHIQPPSLRGIQALPPDVASMARYLHTITTTPYKDVQVLHYPVLKGIAWMNKRVDIPLTQQYLLSMLRSAALRPQYPVSGTHCESCTTRKCLEVFRGQDDNKG